MKQYGLQLIILILISIVFIQLTCNKAPDNSKQLKAERQELFNKLDSIGARLDSVESIIEHKEFNQQVLKNYYIYENNKIDSVQSADSLSFIFRGYLRRLGPARFD